MGRPGPASVDPVQVFAHVNKVTVPGEQKHLAGNLLVLVIITPAHRGVWIAHVLLRARPEQLSPICKAKATRPVRDDALGIDYYQARHLIASFRQHVAFSSNSYRLRSRPKHEKALPRQCGTFSWYNVCLQSRLIERKSLIHLHR